MKKYLFLFCIAPFLILSQTDIKIGENYVITTGVAVFDSDIFGLHSKKTYQIARIGSRFKVTEETDTTYIIQFYNWTLPKTRTEKNAKYFDSQLNKIKKYNLKTVELNEKGIVNLNAEALENQKYFVVYKLNMDKKCISVDDYSKWNSVSGAIVLPFKLRPQTGDFTKDVTINGMVGAGYKFSKNHTLNGILGLGIASVTLDSLNTKGKLNKASERAAISINTGFVYQYKQIQIGVMLGWDFLNQTSADNWIHNKKYWLGLGVGVNLFKPEEGNKENPKIEN